MLMHALADRLGKTIAEVEALSRDEIVHWVAFYKIRSERQDAEADTKIRHSRR